VGVERDGIGCSDLNGTDEGSVPTPRKAM
jgi:hypothetical protein